MKESEGNWCPAIELNDIGKDLILKAELPGVEIRHLDINAESESISISGNHPHHKLLNEQKLIPSQLHYGKLNCNIDLPTKIKVNRVRAELVSGVLTITIPKAEVASTSIK
ncbi:MAG: Hsp20/alpha crystallin family protein [Cyanobacteria bacterium P01_A01_bin.83]